MCYLLSFETTTNKKVLIKIIKFFSRYFSDNATFKAQQITINNSKKNLHFMVHLVCNDKKITKSALFAS